MNRPKLQRPASALSGMRQPSAATRPQSRNSSNPPSESDKMVPLKRPQSAVARSTEANTASNANASSASSETNIQVVVRCRDRNERERAENSGVIISTRVEPFGKAITVQTSPLTELNNKTYAFDRVYGAEATQSMVFDDTVEPIVQEMLGGYNCTIFAYGQTGTGKTYTMSGDMSDYYGKVTDAAGIIPRSLYRIFQLLDLWGDEYSVKCSFIELYNEELRDLLAIQEDQKVKIFDDTTKKGGIVISGMEELAINDAMHGVKILQDGSKKREVAATKCNEASSRSHSVFTITVHIKQTSTDGEDMLRVGKLNLVDLAGSENVGRSGAENKRAREAGMINQSLLTLGRVINALVDRSQHIPYRESKLTRLLQDSLGGRTKTCIIATLSPAKINMDETVSTLEYANRAKSIKNKPQVNQMMTKKALIKDYILEIERLKGDLNSTRQKNGVYMTEESHLELVNQNESNKLLTEEQQRKIDAINEQLKVSKEHFEATMTTLTETKRDLEKTSKVLQETDNKLVCTEKALSSTTVSLEEETHIRKAHQAAEEGLNLVAIALKATLQNTVGDVQGLHSKIDRKRGVESENRSAWTSSQKEITNSSRCLDETVAKYSKAQVEKSDCIADRITEFVVKEMKLFSDGHQYLDHQLSSLHKQHGTVVHGLGAAEQEMADVLGEIRIVREEVKTRLGLGLQGLNKAAERIAEEIASRMGEFQQEVHDSYSQLGSNFKQIFDATQKHISAQNAEIKKLKEDLHAANIRNTTAVQEALREHTEAQNRETQATLNEEAEMLKAVENMVKKASSQREARRDHAARMLKDKMHTAIGSMQDKSSEIGTAMDLWTNADEVFSRRLAAGKEELKRSIVSSARTANERTETMQESTKVIHDETVQLVDAALRNVDEQTQALDEFVTRAHTMNENHHASYNTAIAALVAIQHETVQSVQVEFRHAKADIEQCSKHVLAQTDMQKRETGVLQSQSEGLMSSLRSSAEKQLIEDVPTQTTPKKQEYKFPTTWTTTKSHQELIAEYKGPSIVKDTEDQDRNPLGDIDVNVTSPGIAVSSTTGPDPQHADTTKQYPVASLLPGPKARTSTDKDVKAHALAAPGQENGARPFKTRKRVLG